MADRSPTPSADIASARAEGEVDDVGAPGPTRRADRAATVVELCLAAFGALFVVVRADRTRAFDVAVTLRIQAARSATLARLMWLASWPGFPPQSRVIPPAVVAGWLVARRPRAAAFQLAAWGGAVLSTIVKAAVRRDRPLAPEVRVVVAPLGGTSFPSGHVLTYTAFYGFLAHLVAVHARRPMPRRVVVTSLVALVALVGPSRIQQGHHWPTDVTASYLLGVAYLLVLARLYRATGAPAAPPSPVARAIRTP